MKVMKILYFKGFLHFHVDIQHHLDPQLRLRIKVRRNEKKGTHKLN